MNDKVRETLERIDEMLYVQDADAPPEPTEEMVEAAQMAFDEVWEAFDEDEHQPEARWKEAHRAGLRAAMAVYPKGEG